MNANLVTGGINLNKKTDEKLNFVTSEECGNSIHKLLNKFMNK
jgi:hypothetical protein